MFTRTTFTPLSIIDREVGKTRKKLFVDLDTRRVSAVPPLGVWAVLPRKTKITVKGTEEVFSPFQIPLWRSDVVAAAESATNIPRLYVTDLVDPADPTRLRSDLVEY